MSKISSPLSSWSNQWFEAFQTINPVQTSWMNRVCVRDATWSSGRTWTFLEASKDKLREKIQICKDKAGIRGDKYPSSVEVWKKEIVALAEDAEISDPLPSRASPKHELVYNHHIAKAATNKELECLSGNVAMFASLWVIDTLVGSGKGVESGVLLELIAKSAKTPQKSIEKMYLEHFSKKMGWGFARRVWIQAVYHASSWIVSGIVHTTFQNVLSEMRVSTEGKVEPMFEKLLESLEKFLKDYRGEKNLADFTDNKEVPELCQELAPFLVREFFPEIAFFKPAFGLSLLKPLCWVANSTFGSALNMGIRFVIRGFLPGLLQNLSETALSNLTAPKSESKSYPINYRFANALLRFINDKMFSFASLLEEPSLEIKEPTPPLIAEKLEGVIDQLMKLSTKPSNNKMIREGVRNGLIDGGYQLLKFWQNEQENLLQQVLVLAGLPFTESQEVPDIKAEVEEFKGEWERQNELVELLSDRIFGIEVRNTVAGTPSLMVNHHLAKEHQKIKRYMKEGLSDIIGLKSSLKKALEDLKKPGFEGYDQSLSRHLIFWEGFLSMIKASTKTHYPKPASEDLLRQFLPLCQEGVAQVDHISGLQDEWVLYTRHKALKMHFNELYRGLDLKKVDQFDIEKIEKVLDKIETLLPPNPLEVQILRRFIENFSSVKQVENSLKDLSGLKNGLKKHATLKKEGLDHFRAFLIKYPDLQEDKEFVYLYSTCKELSLKGQGTSPSTFRVIQELTRKIDKEIERQTQALKELQLNLLHRLYPSKSSSDLPVPLPLNSLLQEVGFWVAKKMAGYETLEKKNLEALQEGTKTLQDHVEILERKIQKMEPNPLYFPVESILDFVEWGAGSLGDSWMLRSTKKNLIQDIMGILEGISPLIMAKEEEGKRNLYSWVERLALYEMVKYFKNKSI